MSMIGYKSSNHPQQTAKRGARDDVDDRGTDPAFVAALEDRLGAAFTLDVAAAEHNAKCRNYFDREVDGLSRAWLTPTGDASRVWCNPPYSDIRAWVEKAHQEWTDGHAEIIAMLLPANRVEQKWWQELVEPFRDGRGGHRFLSVEFLPGRMRFDRPGWTKPAKGDRPPFGCCLLIWDRRATTKESA